MRTGDANAGGFDTPPPDGRRTRQSITISFQAREYLSTRQVDAPLAAGARNVIDGTLQLTRGEKLVLVAQANLETLAAALLQAAEAAGAEVEAYLVDPDNARSEPFVARLLEGLAPAQASILLAEPQGLPADFSAQVLEAPGALRRHAHMVGVTEAMLGQSLRADVQEVCTLAQRVATHLAHTNVIETRTSNGTELECMCSLSRRWVADGGCLRGPGVTFLPAGVVYASPVRVQGTLVADGGAWLPDGTAVGRKRRLTLRFDEGRLTGAQGAGAEELLAALDAHPDGRLVGRIGLGVNTSVLAPIGALAQDLTMPGFHVVFGDARPGLTGASWDAPFAAAALVRRPDVTADGRPLLVRGRYANDLGG